MGAITVFILGIIIMCQAQYQYPIRPTEIDNLTVEPEYRGVRLTWRYSQIANEPSDFTLKICEHSSWRQKRPCKSRFLSVDGGKQKPSSHDVLKRLNRGRYEADIYQLRTLTNYTFTLELAYPSAAFSFFNDQKAKSIRSKSVIATTKPFAARASRCLGNSTDVEVQTGPFFGGKITVDQTYDSRCSVLGNPDSPNGLYILSIPHKICGSKVVNKSRIETAVIVHENRELITHNSRKFHVICNFIAEGFTVKASVEVPNIVEEPKPRSEKNGAGSVGFGSIEVEPNEIFDSRQDHKDNNVGDSRFRAEQAAVRIARKHFGGELSKDTVQITVAVCLTTIVSLAIVIISLYLGKIARDLFRKHRQKAELTPEKPKIKPSELAARGDKELLVNDCSLEISAEPIYENSPAEKDNQNKSEIPESKE